MLSALGERAAARGAEAIKRQVRRRIMAGYLQGPLAPVRPESGAVASTIVEQVDALDGFYARFLPAMVQAYAYGPVVVVEEFVTGTEVAVTVVDTGEATAIDATGAYGESVVTVDKNEVHRFVAGFGDERRGGDLLAVAQPLQRAVHGRRALRVTGHHDPGRRAGLPPRPGDHRTGRNVQRRAHRCAARARRCADGCLLGQGRL